jgi:hypothetical protein
MLFMHGILHIRGYDYEKKKGTCAHNSIDSDRDFGVRSDVYPVRPICC